MQELTSAFFTAHPLLVGTFFSVCTLASLSLLGLTWWRPSIFGFPKTPLPPLVFEELDAVMLVGLILSIFIGLGANFFCPVILIFCLFLWYRRTGSCWTYLKASLDGISRDLLIGLWIALAIYLPLQLLSSLVETTAKALGYPIPIQPAVELILQARHLNNLGGILVLAILGAPFAEEFLFRGVVYPLAKNHLTLAKAGLVTGLLFAAMHLHLGSFIPLFLLGWLLCWAFEWSGTLWLNIFIHFWFNLLSASMLVIAKFYS